MVEIVNNIIESRKWQEKLSIYLHKEVKVNEILCFTMKFMIIGMKFAN